jgi:hypothetical protein
MELTPWRRAALLAEADFGKGRHLELVHLLSVWKPSSQMRESPWVTMSNGGQVKAD